MLTFETVTSTAAVVRVLPARSIARAATECRPPATVDESQPNVYGEPVGSEPTRVPSTRKSTCLTPRLSLAFAAKVVVPLMIAPVAGAVRETVGSVWSITSPHANVETGTDATPERFPPHPPHPPRT